MSNLTRTIRTWAWTLFGALVVVSTMIGEASAQKCEKMRTVNVGVAWHCAGWW